MNVDQAKAKLEEAEEVLRTKRSAYLHAKVKADKLEKAYFDAQQDPNLDAQASHKMCGDWYEADRQAENARFEAREADKAYESALKTYENVKAQGGG